MGIAININIQGYQPYSGLQFRQGSFILRYGGNSVFCAGLVRTWLEATTLKFQASIPGCPALSSRDYTPKF